MCLLNTFYTAQTLGVLEYMRGTINNLNTHNLITLFSP